MMALADGGHVRGPGSGTSDSIPARLSDGEFVLPADTVRKVGVKSLRDLVSATHNPSGQPAHPARFADGGPVDTEKRRQSNSFGDAAAVAQDRSVTLVGSGAGASESPAAPAAGLQGVADRVAQIPTDGPKAPAADGSQNSWANTEAGRNLTNAAAALPGVAGAVPAIAKTGGAISSGINAASRLLNVGAATAGTAALPMPASAEPAGQRPLPGGVTPSTAGAGRGSINPPMADPAKPLPSSPDTQPASAPSQLGYGPIGDRMTLTNEQAATMNPAGRITVARGANGTMEFSGGNVSGQVSYNDASGKALPGGGLNGKGFSAFDVAPAGANVAPGPNGSYAFDSGGTQQQTAGGQRSPVGMTVEQAQREGLVGERVGYDPRFDQRVNGAAGQPSPQNMQAADNLATSQTGSARARLMAAGGEQPRPAGVTAPTVLHSGNSWQARNDLRNLEVSASSIMNRPGWEGAGMGRYARQHGTPAATQAYQAAQAADIAARGAQSAYDMKAAQENAAIEREGMQQQGATDRASISAISDAERNQIARGRLAMEQTAAGFQNRTAQRMENAQVAFENAKTPEQQRSARERLLALSGKAPQNEWGLQVTPTTKNPDGSTSQGSVWRYNKTTGDTVRVDAGQGATPAMPSSRDAMVKGQVYQTALGPARWDGGQFQPVR